MELQHALAICPSKASALGKLGSNGFGVEAGCPFAWREPSEPGCHLATLATWSKRHHTATCSLGCTRSLQGLPVIPRPRLRASDPFETMSACSGLQRQRQPISSVSTPMALSPDARDVNWQCRQQAGPICISISPADLGIWVQQCKGCEAMKAGSFHGSSALSRTTPSTDLMARPGRRSPLVPLVAGATARVVWPRAALRR